MVTAALGNPIPNLRKQVQDDNEYDSRVFVTMSRAAARLFISRSIPHKPCGQEFDMLCSLRRNTGKAKGNAS